MRSRRSSDGQAELAMIPIENSIAGRVADIHHLLPISGLHIVGEHFLPIHFQLMALPGAKLEDIKKRSQPRSCPRPVPQDHPQLGLKAVVSGDTAGSAREVAEWGDPTKASLAPAHAGGDLRPRNPRRGCRGREPQHDPLRDPVEDARMGRRPSEGRPSPVSSFASATFRRRSTRRLAGSPPTAST